MRSRPEIHEPGDPPRRWHQPRAAWALACLAALGGGCAENEMDRQPKYQRPYQASRFFADGQSSRPLVAGTVARGHLRADRGYFEGKEKTGDRLIDAVPARVDLAMLARGRQRYDIFCSPCHGRAGDGRGMIVQRGFSAPPSFHQDRLRDVPSGHLFRVITDGYGAMYSYASRIPVDDRWAIVAYIRALQLSQDARLADVPEAERSKLDAGGRTP